MSSINERLQAAREKRGIAKQQLSGANTFVNDINGLSASAEYRKAQKQSIEAAKKQRIDADQEIEVINWIRDFEAADRIQDQVDHFMATRPRRKFVAPHGGAILAQITDVHFGGTVKGLEEREDANEYDFAIAAHRLAAYAEQVIFYGIAHQASEVVIALTGDIFDSKVGKERADKVMHAEGTATESYLRGRDLIKQFIDLLRESEVFGSIRVAGISGNEARLTDERGHGHLTAAENWDSLLNGDLASWYAGSDVELDFGVNRKVVEVEGWRVLLMHGDQAISKTLEQGKIQGVLGTHRADFGISGHIHDTMVTGKWIRSASLIGTDAFAGDGLGLEGMATQNIFWLREGQRNTITVDLQHPDPDIEPFRLFDYRGAFGRR